MKLDKVQSNLIYLLNEYDYEYSERALWKIVNEWNSQKESLRNIFRKHPNWIEEEDMIVFDVNISRTINKDAIFEFRNWAIDTLVQMKELGTELEMWHENNFPCEQFVTEDMIQNIHKSYPDFKAVIGQKTSRAMNKLFVKLGIDKHPDYNREFAKYADALNPLTITRHTVISINLIDYLTMSFGNSWASCHTIDKENKRRMSGGYSGQYSSGTLSYALDETSIVLYTVDSKYDGNKYYFEPKINRQMFHFGEGKLVQGRLYPQSCDGGFESEYTQFRNIMQEIFALCLDVPNLWVLQRGTDACDEAIDSEGTHYQDYNNFENCSVSILKELGNDYAMTVGADPICIQCGSRHEVEDNINCCAPSIICANCGDRIDEDDSYYVDGEYYCEDCVTYCDECEEYHRRCDVRYVESTDRYVCDSCLDNNYTYCDECMEYYPDDQMRYVESTGRDVCDNCLENNYEYCARCDEYYLYEDMKYHDDNFYCEDCYDEIIEEEGEDEYEDEAI